jgi:hypothetical protein
MALSWLASSTHTTRRKTKREGILIKKENKIFLIYKEIKSGAVASHIRLTASSYMGKYLRIYSYIRKPFFKYDFVTAPL